MPRIPEISNTQRELEQAEIELMLRKGTISQIDHTQGGVYKHAITCGKKGRRSESSDKFEKYNFFQALEALQNGKFEFISVSPQERRFA